MLFKFLSDWNKYDIMLFLLIASLAMGGYGGALQATRVLALLFIPTLIPSINFERYNIPGLRGFLCLFLAYATVSILWSPDSGEGLKSLLYYPVHLLIFLEIVAFSKLANYSYKAIALGWLIGFSCLSVVAIREILFDIHLSSSKLEGEKMINNGSGEISLKTFAAGTFFNYNDFNVYICYSTAFIVYLLKTVAKKWQFLSCFAVFMLAFYIVVVNASRGSIISIGIIGVFSLWNLLRGDSNFRWFGIFLVALGAFFVIKNFDSIFYNIMYRMYATEMLDGSTRYDVWTRSFDVLQNYCFMGCGIGGLNSALTAVDPSARIQIPHNMFLEILAQFGVLIFVPFIIGLYQLFRKSRVIEDKNAKNMVFAIFAAMPFFCIVNSTYLLNCSFYAFLGSLFVFAYQIDNNDNQNYFL